MIEGHPKTETEERLLLLIKQDDYSAFDELYNRHWNTLYGLAYNVLRDHEQSKDIVQDIFIWFWEHRAQWNLSSSLGYLLTAVKFKTANFIRANKVKADFFKSASERKIIEFDESVLLEAKELEALIHTITSELPDRCREVFSLSRFQHYSNKEIAAQMGISEKTVEMQITIALRKLRTKLGKGNVFMYFFI